MEKSNHVHYKRNTKAKQRESSRSFESEKKKTKKQNKTKEPRMRTSTEIKGNDKIHCIVNMEKNLVAQGTSISGSLD